MQMQVIDADGEWFVNTGAYSFSDPITKVRFQPGVHVKVKPTAWMSSQTTIKPVEGESAKAAKPVAAPTASVAKK